jgi:nitrogen fixation protein FixH
MKGLLITVIVTGLLIVAISIIVGIKSFDGTVAEDPYEEGLRWDEINRKAEALGLVIELKNRVIRTGENDLIISIKEGDGRPLSSPSVRIHITRPSTDRYDMDVNARRIGDGLYMARVNLPLYGYWQVIIIPEGVDEGVRVVAEIFVEKGG